MAEPAAPAAAAEPGDGSAAQGARAEVSPAEHTANIAARKRLEAEPAG